jgi:VIT1/CCC1 family predicted Fe2+/Mn2+ transporter
MAAGEYVSVSSQTDIERSDIEREKKELEEMPEEELSILAHIYERRGLKKETAALVAKELTEADALGAHVRDELGITELTQANPIQAALASGAAFTAGGFLPLLVTILVPLTQMEIALYSVTIAALIFLGAVAARTGGSSMKRGILRVVIWGTIAMGLSALVGFLFGVRV